MTNKGTPLDKRMKMYEEVSKNVLIRRLPVIIRVDGRAFHSVAKKMDLKGFSREFVNKMMHSAADTLKSIQNCYVCYGQSDEVSFLLTDYKELGTQPWFGDIIQKISSISASLMSSYMSIRLDIPVQFDSRCFNIPREDVENYFVWRQQDAERNSVNMVAQEHFSLKELDGKSCQERLQMLRDKGVDWESFSSIRKYGFIITQRSGLMEETIKFSEDRDYLRSFVNIDKV